MDLARELQRIYDSEINLRISWLWDGGIWNRRASGCAGAGAQVVCFPRRRKGSNPIHVIARFLNLYRADFSRMDLSGADLCGAVLVDTNLEDAILTGARVFGISAWKVKLQNAVQNSLVITPMYEPEITVDNLEVAQFIYLLLHNSKIRDVIDTIGRKGVLLLGRFTERKELLDSIAAKLRDLKYLPIIFEFERPTDRD